jgi:hypothetical protein
MFIGAHVPSGACHNETEASAENQSSLSAFSPSGTGIPILGPTKSRTFRLMVVTTSEFVLPILILLPMSIAERFETSGKWWKETTFQGVRTSAIDIGRKTVAYSSQAQRTWKIYFYVEPTVMHERALRRSTVLCYCVLHSSCTGPGHNQESRTHTATCILLVDDCTCVRHPQDGCLQFIGQKLTVCLF